MDQRLQQAIASARSGKTKEAQYLLTQLLKDDPEEVQGWFLLSHLVDSADKQIAYLRKTVALDPDHQMAAERLAALEAETAVGFASDTIGLPEGESVPEWMAQGAEEFSLEAAITDPPLASESEKYPWLQETSVAEELATMTEARIKEELAKPASAAVRPPRRPSASRRSNEAQLNRLLTALIAAAAIVTVWLIYVVLVS